MGPAVTASSRPRYRGWGPDEVLIQVAYVGVCARDLEVANGQLDYYQRGLAQYPIVPGHEYSGIVVRSGASAGHLRKGQKVVGHCAVGCGHCPACDVGEDYRCDSREEVGVISRNGAYAHYMAVPSRCVHKLPSDMPLRHGPLVEPIAVCLKGLRELAIQGGRSACVVGAGSTGNLCAQILQARGLHVSVVDPDPHRLRLLQKYDIDTLTELEGLGRYDYLVEASGCYDREPHLLDKSNPSAKFLFLGVPYSSPVQTLDNTVTGYDKAIYASLASRRSDWEDAIRLIHSGVIRLDDHTAVVEAARCLPEGVG